MPKYCVFEEFGKALVGFEGYGFVHPKKEELKEELYEEYQKEEAEEQK